MKDRLIAVANQLSDIAAEYEEKVSPKSWVTDGWKELLNNMADYSPHLEFSDDTDPTEVVHTLFMRIQELEGNKRKKDLYSTYFNWGLEGAQQAAPQQDPAQEGVALRNFREQLQRRNDELRMAEVAQRAQMEQQMLQAAGVNPFLRGAEVRIVDDIAPGGVLGQIVFDADGPDLDMGEHDEEEF